MERKQVVLAGGIGSGKSEVGKLLAQRGACVIDSDNVGHQILEPGGEAVEEVAAAFPIAVVDGVIDRSILAAEVFSSPVRLQLLESLTHPAIRVRIRRRVQESSTPLVVVEVPLVTDFLGPGWLMVVVDAPEEVRLRRLVDRGMDPEDARRRMRSQPRPEEWRDAADFLVDNSGDLGDLEREVARLWAVLTA